MPEFQTPAGCVEGVYCAAHLGCVVHTDCIIQADVLSTEQFTVVL